MDCALRRFANLSTTAIIGALIGFIGWGHGLTLIAALMPLTWLIARSKGTAFIGALAYYLAGSRVIPSAADVFFGEASSLALGLALWFAAGVLLAAPWGLLYANTTPLNRLLRLSAALAFVSIPPLGLIGWLNPLLGAAQVIPGHGAASLIAGAIILWLLTVPSIRTPIPALLPTCAILAIISAQVLQESTSRAPEEWVGLTTHVGPTPAGLVQEIERYRHLIQLTNATLADPVVRIVVLPEQFAGYWNRNAERFVEAAIGPILRERDATVIFGAAIPTGDTAKTTNSLLLYDGEQWHRYDARHAVPVSMWRPWADDTTVLRPLQSGVLTVRGQRALISICFEDYVVWLPLWSLLTESPELIVSSGNGWWVRGSAAQQIQLEHIEAWARIFDLPLVRAVNAS